MSFPCRPRVVRELPCNSPSALRLSAALAMCLRMNSMELLGARLFALQTPIVITVQPFEGTLFLGNGRRRKERSEYQDDPSEPVKHPNGAL